MMNICVMGNSHTGSLKRAWDNINVDFPEVEITFFAGRANVMNNLFPKNGKLTPNNQSLAKFLEFTSGGKKEIDVREYNVFVIYGVSARPCFFLNDQFYSKAVIENSLNNFVDNTLSFNLLKRLRTLTENPVFIGHDPLPAGKQILSDTTPHEYIAGIELINDVIYRPLKAELVCQSLGTIVNGNKTHPDFSKNSKRLAIGDKYDDELHPEDDANHMNDKFGEIWIRELLNKYIEWTIDHSSKQ